MAGSRIRIAAVWTSILVAVSVAPGCDASPTETAARLEPAWGPALGLAPVAGVTPSTATVAVGSTVQLTALGKYGNHIKDAAWASSNPAVATVSRTGLVAGVSVGQVKITATSGGVSGSAQVTVGDGSTAEPASTPTPEPTEDPIEEAVQEPVSTGSLGFQDGFETGARAAAQGGYRWRLPSAKSGDAVVVTREKVRTGSYSLKFQYGADARLCDDSWAEQGFELGENLQEVWFEYYVYLPKVAEGGVSKFLHRQPTVRNSDGTCSTKADVSGNNKFFALWDTVYDRAKGGDVRVLAEYRRTSLAGEGDSNLYGMWGTDTRTAGHYNQEGSRWDPAFTDALRGRWVQVRIRARVADSKLAANGFLKIWVDGALRVNMQGLDLAPEPGGARFFREGYLMGWSNSGFNQTTAVYLDDFKIYRASPGW